MRARFGSEYMRLLVGNQEAAVKNLLRTFQVFIGFIVV